MLLQIQLQTACMCTGFVSDAKSWRSSRGKWLLAVWTIQSLPPSSRLLDGKRLPAARALVHADEVYNQGFFALQVGDGNATCLQLLPSKHTTPVYNRCSVLLSRLLQLMRSSELLLCFSV